MHNSSKCNQQSHSPSQLLASVSVPGRHGRLLKSGWQSSQFVPMVLWSQEHPEFNCQQKVTNIKDIAIRLPRTRFQRAKGHTFLHAASSAFLSLSPSITCWQLTSLKWSLCSCSLQILPTIWLAMHGRCTDSKSYIFRIAPIASIINF